MAENTTEHNEQTTNKQANVINIEYSRLADGLLAAFHEHHGFSKKENKIVSVKSPW